MPSAGSPKAEDAVALKDALKLKFAPRNAKITGIRDWRRDLHQPKAPPDGFEGLAVPYHPPDVKRLIRAGQALIATKLPTIHRTAIDLKNQRARGDAELIARWFNEGALIRMLKDVDWWAMVTDSLAEGPNGVWKCMLSKHAWATLLEGAEEKYKDDDEGYNDRVETVRRQHFPFVCEHVPTTTYLPARFGPGGNLCEVVECTMRERPLLLDQYGKELQKAGMVTEGDGNYWQTGEVECFEYWNDDTFQFYIEDKLVKEGTHKGGRPPYFAASFSQTGVHDPAFESECLVDPILSDCEQFQDFFYKKGVWASLVCFPGFQLKPRSDDAIEPYGEKQKIEWGPGKTTQPPVGWEWLTNVIPGTGQDLNQILQFHKQSMEEGSLAQILFGKGGGDMSGPVQQNAIQLAHATFGPCTHSLARAFAQMCSYMLRLIETDIKAPVPVEVKANGEWLLVGPDEIDGYYDVTAELEPIIRMAEVVRYTEASDMQVKGYVTKQYVRKLRPDIGDAEEMADAVLTEAMEESNQVQALIMAELMTEIQADKAPPPPTVEQITGQPQPGVGTPQAVPAGMPGNIPGGGMPVPPGLGNQPVAPGMQPSLPAPQPVPNGRQM